MNTLIIGLVSILCYLISAAIIAKDAYTSDKTSRISISFGWFAAGSHLLYKYLAFQGFNFSFFEIGSLISLLVSLMLLISSLDKPVINLGLAIFPISAAMLAFDMAFPETRRTLSTHNWQMSTHILSSITAFSLLNMAALQSILIAVQDQQLRNHHPKSLIRSLPPLQAMESMLFQMIAYGVIFLTISLVSGFIFIEDLFAQHLVHKTVLSISAWIIFSSLLAGRIKYGWRGQTAIKWTLIGFVLLLLAYFGSKLVLELILHRK